MSTSKEIREKQLKQIEEMITSINDGLTKEEFIEAFEQVAKVVKQIKETNQKHKNELQDEIKRAKTELRDVKVQEVRNQGEKHQKQIKLLRQEIKDAEKKLTKIKDENLTNTLDKINKQADKLFQEERNTLNFIKDKAKELKSGEDGKDADEPKIVSEILKKIDLPDELTSEQIRDKLEKLKGEERLNVSAIDGLEEKFEEVKKTKSVGGGGIIGKNMFKNIDISDKLDGSTKTFNIQSVWNILSVDLSSFPYGALRKGTDYTHNSNSITFTDEIDVGTQLNSGQTCIIVAVTSA